MALSVNDEAFLPRCASCFDYTRASESPRALFTERFLKSIGAGNSSLIVLGSLSNLSRVFHVSAEVPLSIRLSYIFLRCDCVELSVFPAVKFTLEK